MKAGAEEDPWAWVHICPFKQIHLREAIAALPSGVRKGNHRDPCPTPVIPGGSYNGHSYCHRLCRRQEGIGVI